MTYKRIRDLAVFGLALLLSMSLSGCSFSFLGFRVGRSEDFVFYCAEEVEGGQAAATANGDSDSSAATAGSGESQATAVESAQASDGFGEAGTATEGSVEGIGGGRDRSAG